jgi:multiple sugar transport system substrate-binding protein
MRKEYLRIYYVLAFLLVVLLLSVTACTSPEISNQNYELYGTQGVVSGNERELSANESECDFHELNDSSSLSGTLTISQCWDFSVHSLDFAIERFTSIHPGVEISLTNFRGDSQRYITQVGMQLMAGTADDIIEWHWGFSYADFADRGFLTDIYTLMRDDYRFTYDDWFSNAFRAAEYRGGLYVFPLSFSYEIIGVNSTTSDELVESFRQFDMISHRQLLDLYIEFSNATSHFISPVIDAANVIIHDFGRIIDFEANTANFNTDEFIRLVSDARDASNPQRVEAGLVGNWGSLLTASNWANQIELSYNYMFSNFLMNIQYEAFFPHEDYEIFTHFIPLATCDGEIIITSVRQFAINSASENKELAWEFLKFLATDEILAKNEISLGIPINRHMFDAHAVTFLTNYVESQRGLPGFVDVSADTSDIVERIIEHVNRYVEKPMHNYNIFRDVRIIEMIIESMTAFHQGILTAEMAAEDLQNRVSLYLMERG